jgi:hypothetical protein
MEESSFESYVVSQRDRLCFSLQIQRPGFDSRCYQIFCVVGLERGPLSLVST